MREQNWAAVHCNPSSEFRFTDYVLRIKSHAPVHSYFLRLMPQINNLLSSLALEEMLQVALSSFPDLTFRAKQTSYLRNYSANQWRQYFLLTPCLGSYPIFHQSPSVWLVLCFALCMSWCCHSVFPWGIYSSSSIILEMDEFCKVRHRFSLCDLLD